MAIDRASLEERFRKAPHNENRLRFIEQLIIEGMSLFDAESKVMAMLPQYHRKSANLKRRKPGPKPK